MRLVSHWATVMCRTGAAEHGVLQCNPVRRCTETHTQCSDLISHKVVHLLCQHLDGPSLIVALVSLPAVKPGMKQTADDSATAAALTCHNKHRCTGGAASMNMAVKLGHLAAAGLGFRLPRVQAREDCSCLTTSLWYCGVYEHSSSSSSNVS